MAKNWLDTVTSYSYGWDRKEIRELFKRRFIFLLWPAAGRDFIVPDFQIRDDRINPWIAPLLGSLVWIEDKMPDRDKNGVARAKWLYRKHAYLSEMALATIGHRPPPKEPDACPARDYLNLLPMGLGCKPRSFAEIFAIHPRLVIDYQYRLQGVRWDAREYQM